MFIAGAGREVTRLAELAYARLRPGGRLVVNLISIDHIADARAALTAAADGEPNLGVWMVNIARGGRPARAAVVRGAEAELPARGG